MVWTLNDGCFGMRMVPRKAISARMKNVAAGMSANAKSTAPMGAGYSQKLGIVIGGPCKLEKGRIHPPSHSVTAMDETAIMAAYSARKNSDHRKPLYSVWKPATSSDSASGKSKGARLVSATMAM